MKRNDDTLRRMAKEERAQAGVPDHVRTAVEETLASLPETPDTNVVAMPKRKRYWKIPATVAAAFLAICLGEPPSVFDFEYRDKDKEFHRDAGITPRGFYDKYVGVDLAQEYVSLVNSPTEDKPYYQTFCIDFLGNVAEGRPVHYLNIPMNELKDLIDHHAADPLSLVLRPHDDIGYVHNIAPVPDEPAEADRPPSDAPAQIHVFFGTDTVGDLKTVFFHI